MNNKYVKAFKEAVKKLQEHEFDPTIMSIVDYDVDDLEIEEDKELRNEIITLIEKLNEIAKEFRELSKKYQNNKIKQLYHYLSRAIKQILDRVTITIDVDEYTKRYQDNLYDTEETE